MSSIVDYIFGWFKDLFGNLFIRWKIYQKKQQLKKEASLRTIEQQDSDSESDSDDSDDVYQQFVSFINEQDCDDEADLLDRMDGILEQLQDEGTMFQLPVMVAYLQQYIAYHLDDLPHHIPEIVNKIDAFQKENGIHEFNTIGFWFLHVKKQQ